jgi:hypothetical protein
MEKYDVIADSEVLLMRSNEYGEKWGRKRIEVEGNEPGDIC